MAQTTSETNGAAGGPLYVYLQRPDTGQWATVGRYLAPGAGRMGLFRYAPSYIEAGLGWSIDPVNLPVRPDKDFEAVRYGGLHDTLRDAGPDAWGQVLMQREHGLAPDAPAVRYLVLAGNADRWGALAVGRSRSPSVAELRAPRLLQLAHLTEELLALAEDRPAVHPALRRRLVQSASVGGARPKATVQDVNGRLWLAKPRLPSDVADIPMLEHAAHRWGAASGLAFAPTELHTEGHGVMRVLRFDRAGETRLMCVSAASLLQAECPGGFAQKDRWSYPRLAEELRRIGAPVQDRIELFGRMVFNAVCGNDDDHVRNHAVVWSQPARCWRLSPAFDVVPNPLETPRRLAMQLATGRFDISREAVMTDAHRFGFDSRPMAEQHLDELLARIGRAFEATEPWLDARWREALHARMRENLSRLRLPESGA